MSMSYQQVAILIDKQDRQTLERLCAAHGNTSMAAQIRRLIRQAGARELEPEPHKAPAVNLRA